MTLIDKAEALAAIEAWFAETKSFAPPSLVDAIAALPARGVGVKPLIFSEFKEGGCMGRPHPFQYFITQAHNGRFLCHHDETWHETLEAAQAHAQVAYQIAAIATTEAARVDHEGLLDWLGSFPPPNDKLRQTYADYQKAISDGRLKVAPTDAAHVNETPKSEHDGADVLTAAQAREAALKKAAQLAYEVWDDPEALAKAILALIGETRT